MLLLKRPLTPAKLMVTAPGTHFLWAVCPNLIPSSCPYLGPVLAMPPDQSFPLPQPLFGTKSWYRWHKGSFVLLLGITLHSENIILLCVYVKLCHQTGLWVFEGRDYPFSIMPSILYQLVHYHQYVVDAPEYLNMYPMNEELMSQ